MKTLVSRFVKDESGATAIEYGLIAAGISVAIIAVVNGLGTNTGNAAATQENSTRARAAAVTIAAASAGLVANLVLAGTRARSRRALPRNHDFGR